MGPGACEFRFSFHNSLIKFTQKQYEKKQSVSKNMTRCHFLLVTVIVILLIYKEFFKNMKMSIMFLRIVLVKILIFCLFPNVI